MDRNNSSASQALSLPVGRRLERFAMRAKPCILDAVAAHPRIHAARNCLHLGQFWHRLILGDEGSKTFAEPSVRLGRRFYSDLRWSLNCLIRFASKLTIRHVPRVSFTYTRV